jgi:hypothetical protein
MKYTLRYCSGFSTIRLIAVMRLAAPMELPAGS